MARAVQHGVNLAVVEPDAPFVDLLVVDGHFLSSVLDRKQFHHSPLFLRIVHF
jgi:hypothetical protein